MSVSLLSLPPEISALIFLECSYADLKNLCITCKILRLSIVSNILLWKKLCMRDFQIKKEELQNLNGVSYRQLYTQVLHRYGYMLGLYRTNFVPYGALLEVTFRGGVVRGVHWSPEVKDDVLTPLRHTPVFAVSLHQDRVTTVCAPGLTQEPHACTIRQDKESGVIFQKCLSPEQHKAAVCANAANHDRSRIAFIIQEIFRELRHIPIEYPGVAHVPGQLLTHHGALPPHLFAPGLFKGSYGPHGVELVIFQYKSATEIHGVKVTGDPNVYADEISVKIFINQAFVLQEEEQSSFEGVKNAMASQAELIQRHEQAFRTPHGCLVEGPPPPDTCSARYNGELQRAFEGFLNPMFTSAHVMVFTQDLLGLLWIDQKELFYFSRVNRKFQKNNFKRGSMCCEI